MTHDIILTRDIRAIWPMDFDREHALFTCTLAESTRIRFGWIIALILAAWLFQLPTVNGPPCIFLSIVLLFRPPSDPLPWKVARNSPIICVLLIPCAAIGMIEMIPTFQNSWEIIRIWIKWFFAICTLKYFVHFWVNNLKFLKFHRNANSNSLTFDSFNRKKINRSATSVSCIVFDDVSVRRACD